MLIIGHRGAAGLAHENTMESFRVGFESGADMLECDVRLTKDNHLVVIHDSRLARTHRRRDTVSSLTLEKLRALTSEVPVPLLTELLDAYFGKILLNIELKSRGSGEQLIALLKKHYIRKSSDWDKFIISSFKGTELLRIRRIAPKANLALLHGQNPFIFVAYTRLIGLTAVGFHRLYINSFALEIAKRAHLFIYVYTVNRPAAIPYLRDKGIEGVVTNFPDKFVAALASSQARHS